MHQLFFIYLGRKEFENLCDYLIPKYKAKIFVNRTHKILCASNKISVHVYKYSFKKLFYQAWSTIYKHFCEN